MMSSAFGEDFEHLSEERVQQFKDKFNLFDKLGNGTILRTDIGTVIRSLGVNPTEAELADVAPREGEDMYITFSEFTLLMQRKLSTQDTEEDLINAFRVFDVNLEGKISVEDMKRVLMTYGEVLTEEQIDEAIKEAQSLYERWEPGVVEYKDFIRLMML